MRRLVLFARPPERGQVKTRLSPALPPRLAGELYRGLLADTVAATDAAHCDERCLAWADGEGPLVPGWRSSRQRGDTLGQRLENAFADLLGDGTCTLVVGTDAPEIEPTA